MVTSCESAWDGVVLFRLVDAGHRVVGVEFVEKGVVELFKQHQWDYTVEDVHHMPGAKRYKVGVSQQCVLGHGEWDTVCVYVEIRRQTGDMECGLLSVEEVMHIM